MKKKFISLALLAGMLLSAMTGCSTAAANEETDETDDAASNLTATITLTAITGKSTTPEAIEAVQEALNKLTKSEFKTQVILQLKTEDEYVDFIDSQVEKIKAEIEAEEEAEKKAKEEAKKKKEAEKLANANKKHRSKWTTTTKAETEEETGETQAMTEDEYGREVVKYPELEGTSLDILFITGMDMYRDFVEKEYLQSLNEQLVQDSKILNKYIHPIFLEAGKSEGSTYAIANNRLIGEYTYMLIDKDLAEKYDIEPRKVKTLGDLEEFLDAVKADEKDYTPINMAPEMNYVQYPTGEESMIGSVIKPSYTTASKAMPKNLLLNEAYVNHYRLIDKLNAEKYVGTGDKYAVQIVKGDVTTPEVENWEENYEVLVYEAPITTNEILYSGMFAVSAYASDLERCMEVITLLNTDAEMRNIYAYGVEGVNYKFNEDGTVHMLNNDWSMDFYHTGNTFIGAVPEGMPVNYAEVGKLQNMEAIMGPYVKWQYENEENAALLKDFNKLSEKYMKDFKNASDKVAWSEAAEKEMTENETIAKMLNAEESAGLVGSYVEFHSATYPSAD